MKRQSIRVIVLCLALAAGAWSYGGAFAQSQPSPPPAASPVVTVPGTPPAVAPDRPSQPAMSVHEVTSPAAPSHYQEQALWALMVSFLIQWLKRQPRFGWITEASEAKFKAQFGFLMAFLTAAGIHFAVSGNIWEDGGASITVSGLSFNLLKDVVWQWTAQQGWYQTVVKERSR